MYQALYGLKGPVVVDPPGRLFYIFSEGGRHCRIVHRSARSERPSALPLPAESCGTRRGWSLCELLVTVNAPAATGVPSGVMGTRPSR